MMERNLAIDEAILSVAEPSWRKVALVIVKVAEKMDSDLPAGDAGCDFIAARIEILIRSGRLVSRGDVTKWRRSEVRKSN
jgi:uncharacterized protein DUF3658